MVYGPLTLEGIHDSVWIPNWGYIQAFGSQSGLQLYTRVFGVQTGATHGCLESQTGGCVSCQPKVTQISFRESKLTQSQAQPEVDPKSIQSWPKAGLESAQS